MPLFIFNSKYNFIIRSIVAFGIILILYSFCVYFLPRTLQGGNQWQSNILKAQNFVFSNEKWNVVIVGSSMASNVPIEKLSVDVYNLAFASGSSNTGLKILRNVQNKNPKVIFIEVNEMVMRGIDNDTLKKTNDYFRYIPFLQEINRPDVVFLQTIQLIKTKTIGKKEVVSNDSEEPIESMLKNRQKSLNNLVDEKNLEERIGEIEDVVVELKKQGVDIVFIEPPMHPSLFDAERTKQVRNAFLEKFPQDKYCWFFVEWSDYKTKDGIHLDSNSARRYAEELMNYSKVLLSARIQ